ncbi:MAG TPA: hypothetical protein VMF32_25460 [Xanthobacteraceae bacterium]|nr:hypothetical protein [Xanthobacteraceae bacterium]
MQANGNDTPIWHPDYTALETAYGDAVRHRAAGRLADAREAILRLCAALGLTPRRDMLCEAPHYSVEDGFDRGELQVVAVVDGERRLIGRYLSTDAALAAITAHRKEERQRLITPEERAVLLSDMLPDFSADEAGTVALEFGLICSALAIPCVVGGELLGPALLQWATHLQAVVAQAQTLLATLSGCGA